MKVFLGKRIDSFGQGRILAALSAHLPANIEAVDEAQADLVVLHVIGRNEHVTKQALEIKAQGKDYAVIQYALKSTRNPDPQDWRLLWKDAKVVWSYYDLDTLNFYHAPLAADPNTFYPQETGKKYTVGTDGNCYRAECIGENHLAAWQAGGNAVHVGEKFNSDPIVNYLSHINDDELRVVHNQCEHFSSLRRKEGFEIPAVQSLLCGVRPIMFDTPNYRQWFDGLAEFIPEGSVSETVASLKKIFKRKPRPVTENEIAETKRRFDWKPIVEGFWERCMT